MTAKLIYLFLNVSLLVILLSSCGNSDKKQLEEVLSRREKAFETKNAELYLSCISPSYSEEKNGQVIGIDDLTTRFMQNVSLFDLINISYSDRNIYLKGNKAEVAQKVDVEVSIEKDKSRFRVSERLEFERMNGQWLVTKESEADFLSGFVFGGKARGF